MEHKAQSENLNVLAMRPFLPAKAFQESLRFYRDLGFDSHPIGDGLASMHLGLFACLLQDHYVDTWPDKGMMRLLVRDIDAWRDYISALRLSDRYQVKTPAEPKAHAWGLAVCYEWGPSGVLWRFAQAPERKAPASAKTR